MSTRRIFGSVLLLLSLIAAPAVPRSCAACDGWATWCAWQRTWHTPYVLDMPLRDYFVPRTPGRCDGPIQTDGTTYAACGWGVGQTMAGLSDDCGTYGAAPPCAFCDPGRFERLGQIPNDLELSIGAPASAPSR